MKKLWLLLSLLLSLPACDITEETSSRQGTKDLKRVILALDYIPNTDRTGIYVAKEEGYHKEAGLDVQIIEPGDNSTSIGLVGADKVQFGISYQEDVTYAHVDGKSILVKAVAIVIKYSTSGSATLPSSNIHPPKGFEGRTYAGQQSPSEEAVLKAVIKKDGGDFSKLTIVGNNGEGLESLGKSLDI